ncbi:MAG TPA: NAD(P)-dependent oxidoreductase [Candidatus Saccharimonadales bacterium]|nr:NAD(P)-dependent oxidoreductase [Candidatus Saccharimonadales bacterium]
MKILITGASGNVGREVSRALGQTNQLVYVSRSAPKQVPDGAHYAVDMADPTELPSIFEKEKPDAVIHLAAMLGAICDQEPELAQKVNVEATRLLAELSVKHGVGVFLFPSTAAAYNQTELAATDEDHNVDPRSIYGKTKVEAERALEALSKTGATRFAALRIFNVYGPEFAASLVYKLAHSSPDAPVSLFGMDTFYRDYIHVDDLVKVLANLQAYKNLPVFSVFNIAGGKATNNTELIAQLTKQGFDPQYVVQEAAPSYSWANISRAKEQLGFDPATAITL